jgi:hypothetical protein
MALANLAGSLLRPPCCTLGAEIGGVGLALQLATSVDYLLWVPVDRGRAVGGAVAGQVRTLENVFGLTGLGRGVFVIASFRLGGTTASSGSRPAIPGRRTARTGAPTGSSRWPCSRRR